jgi:magnesium-transporting ATPase (P-type)
MQSVYELATNIYEPMLRFWEDHKTERAISGMLVLIFLAALAGIELKRQGLLPDFLAGFTPDHHFHAVSVAFTLVLILEVIGLIFALPCSFSKSMGKQFEILSLILMRNSFKELVNFPEPIHIVAGSWTTIVHIVADGTGALIIFALLGVYSRMHPPKQRHARPGPDRYSFIASKKIVALILLALFAALGVKAIWEGMIHNHTFDFFDTFYTVLVFADILLVLLSQRFLPGYLSVFRNSGYALATLFIRLALAAPPFYNTAMGIGAAVYAVALTWTFNRLADRPEEGEGHA